MSKMGLLDVQDIAQASTYGGLMHRAMGKCLHPDALRQVINSEHLRPCCDPGSIRDCRHPVVALIEGICVGGSLELACMADLRICGALLSTRI